MAKKRRLTEQSQLLENSAAGGTERPPTQPRQAPVVNAQPKRFACVFAKRYPSNTTLGRVCLGPGFSSVARLKEHMYRKHRSPIHCPRCLNIFATEPELKKHLNAPERCQEADCAQDIVGLSATQITELKQKTRGKNGSEEDRWRKVYSIVFPDVDEASIPGPYYDYGDGFHQLTRLEDFIRSQTIPETERMLSAEFAQVPVEMRRQIPRLVLSILEKLCGQFRLLEETEIPDGATQPSQGEMEANCTFESLSNGSSTSGRVAELTGQQEKTQTIASGVSGIMGFANEQSWSELGPIPQQPELAIEPMVPISQLNDTTIVEFGMMSFTDGLGWERPYEGGYFLPDKSQ